MSDKLRNCPFCDNAASRGASEDGGSYISRVYCDASTALYYDRCENLESAWNTRTDPVKAQLVEALKVTEHKLDQFLQGQYPDGKSLGTLLRYVRESLAAAEAE